MTQQTVGADWLPPEVSWEQKMLLDEFVVYAKSPLFARVLLRANRGPGGIFRHWARR